jgi:hypothetical protein
MRKCRELWPSTHNHQAINLMKGPSGWRTLFANAYFSGDWERVIALAPAVKAAAERAARPAPGRCPLDFSVEESVELTREWLYIAR